MLFGHSKNKFEYSNPLVTKRLGSLGWNGILDHVHFRFKRPNTFSAVHHGLYLALKRLGHEVYWSDNVDSLDNNSVIFTEAKYLADLGDLNKYYKVILHAEPTAFEKIVHEHRNVYFWENYKGNHNKSQWESIAPLTFYNNSYRSIQMPWASDVFSVKKTINNIEKSYTYYVGNFSTDALSKAKSLRSKEFNFYRVGGVSFEVAREFVEKSEFTFDIRNQHCIDYGFIPCRIFKNYSYGKICFSNSKHISKCFDIPYYNDLETLLKHIENYRSGHYNDLVKNLQGIMIDHHTYLNRVAILRSVVGF